MTELFYSWRFKYWVVMGYDFKNKDWYPLTEGFKSRQEAEEMRLTIPLEGNFKAPY